MRGGEQWKERRMESGRERTEKERGLLGGREGHPSALLQE